MNNPEQGPRHVPGVEGESGVTADYINEVFGLKLKLDQGGIEAVIAQILEIPIQRYTEKFSPSVYQDVVTEKNGGAVARLDEIAEELNIQATNGTLTRAEFVSLYNEVEYLIRRSAVRYIK